MKISLLVAVLIASIEGFDYTVSSWTDNSKSLTRIAVGSFGVWGVDANNDHKIYYKEVGSSSFTLYPGTLKDISVGRNQVWGVTPAGNAYRKVGNANWVKIRTGMMQVSVSEKGRVWGIDTSNNLLQLVGSEWRSVPWKMKCVSVGLSGVWAITTGGSLYYRTGTYGDVGTRGTSWQSLPWTFKWVSSGKDIVFAVQTNNNVFYRAGITAADPTGTSWQPAGTANQVDVWGTQAWGIANNKARFLTVSPEPCQLTRIEILSTSMQREYVGTKIIGISSAGSCFGSGTGVLTLAHSSAIEETIGIELSEETGIDWSVSTSVEVTAGVEFFGLKTEVTVGLEVGVGGSKTYGKTETSSTSTTSGSEVSHQTNYDAPGAALTVGAVEKYATNIDAIPVKQHYQCSPGDTYWIETTIKLSQQHYEAAHFEDMRGQFYRDACIASSYSLPDCVSNLKSRYNGFVGDITELRLKFADCFADGKGFIAKLKRE